MSVTLCLQIFFHIITYKYIILFLRNQHQLAYSFLSLSFLIYSLFRFLSEQLSVLLIFCFSLLVFPSFSFLSIISCYSEKSSKYLNNSHIISKKILKTKGKIWLKSQIEDNTNVLYTEIDKK